MIQNLMVWAAPLRALQFPMTTLQARSGWQNSHHSIWIYVDVVSEVVRDAGFHDTQNEDAFCCFVESHHPFASEFFSNEDFDSGFFPCACLQQRSVSQDAQWFVVCAEKAVPTESGTLRCLHGPEFLALRWMLDLRGSPMLSTVFFSRVWLLL